MALGDFTNQADSYQRSRPTYPKALIDFLVADADLKSGDPVADFGAGTGIFTELLLERGFAVTAIEPNDSMRAKAGAKAASWINGTFENSGLETASQHWAVAAQAFHWADPEMSLPELRRILKPDSLLTVLWNDRVKAECEIVRWTEDAIRRHVPEFDEAYRIRSWKEVLESTGDFRFDRSRSYSHSIVMSRERYLELWKSHNRLNTIAGPDRFARFFQELTDYLAAQNSHEFEVRYECKSWSARRVD